MSTLRSHVLLLTAKQELASASRYKPQLGRFGIHRFDVFAAEGISARRAKRAACHCGSPQYRAAISAKSGERLAPRVFDERRALAAL